MINEKSYEIRTMDYTTNVYAQILNFFENLNHLNVQSFNVECPVLSLRGLPSTTFLSLTLTKLCIAVNYFEDCLCLLDGRLKQLSTFIVVIRYVEDHSSIVSNSVSIQRISLIFRENGLRICSINMSRLMKFLYFTNH
jgi:hypothetical protein